MSAVIAIIGAGPGIGQAVAKRFGREQWAVVLIGRRADRLARLAAELAAEGITAHAVPADASDPDALRAALAEAGRVGGPLTAVHYNAAVVRHQDLFSMTDGEIASDLAVNVAGGLYAIRSAVAEFATRGGTILVTGGGLGVTPSADWASLGLGKAALRNVVQGLAGPLAEQGIRIGLTTVATGVAPESREATEVAEAFWRLATDRDASWEAVYPPPASRSRDEGARPPNALTLIARLTAKAQHADALGEGLRGLIAPTLAEEGSIGYVLHRGDDDRRVWILYETWRSRADLEAHFEQPYTKAMLSRFTELLDRPMELTYCTAIR